MFDEPLKGSEGHARPAAADGPKYNEHLARSRDEFLPRLVVLSLHASRPSSYTERYLRELDFHARDTLRIEWEEAELEQEFHCASSHIFGTEIPRANCNTGLCSRDHIRRLLVDWHEVVAAQTRSKLYWLEQEQSDDPQLIMDVVSRVHVTMTLHERVGFGSLGEIYRASAFEWGANVALKVSYDACVDVPDMLTRVDSLRQLMHPNIAPVYASGTYYNRVCCVRAFVEGESLASVACRARFRDPARAAQLILTAARALQAAHQRGVLHLALRPQNIIVDEQDEPTICDFLLTARSNGKRRAHVARDPFAAPEQTARGSEAMTIAADVYALGAILRFLLTGDEPAPTRWRDRARFALSGAAARLTRTSRLALDLERICLVALNPQPSQRYANINLLIEALERALLGQRALRLPRGGAKSAARLFKPSMTVLVVVCSAVVNGAWLYQAGVRHASDLMNARSNDAVAVLQAKLVERELSRVKQEFSQTAANPELADLLKVGQLKSSPSKPPDELADFDRSAVVDSEGKLKGQWVRGDQEYEGAALARIVTRIKAQTDPTNPVVLWSESTRSGERHVSDALEINLAARVNKPNGVLAGVLLGTRAMDSVVGDVLAETSWQKSDLLGDQDLRDGRERSDAAIALVADTGFAVAVSSKLDSGAGVPNTARRIGGIILAVIGLLFFIRASVAPSSTSEVHKNKRRSGSPQLG